MVKHVVVVGTERAKVLGKWLRSVRAVEAQLEIERTKLAIAAEAVLAGTDSPGGQIVDINEVDGTITVEV